MLLSVKQGIITNISDFETKEGKRLISVQYSSGNSDTLQKTYISEQNENFSLILNVKEDLIGRNITQKIEISE